MQRVRLLGELGELFGAEFIYYNLRRPADAIKMLCINRPAFKDYLLNSEENGVAFQVIQANAAMVFDDLLLPFGSNDLVIAPVISGSGGPVGKIITGVALVVAAVVTGGIASAGVALGGFLGIGTVGTAVVAVGAAMALSGVAQLVSPQPQVPLSIGSLAGIGGGAGGGAYGGGARFGSRNRTNGPESVTRGLDGQQSYAYTGAVNTVGVGQTVPLAYGKVLIGSHLLRSKVQVTDESDPLLSFIKKPGTDTMLVGGEKFATTFDDVSGAVIKKVEPFKDTFKGHNDTETPLGVSGVMYLNKAQGGSQSASAFTKMYNSQKENFNVVFTIETGLSNSVAGAGTTLVDAFVTYEVNVYRTKSPSQANLIAVDTVTVQGLLDSSTSNKFQYMHKMELPTEGSASNCTVEVKIIDSDGDIGSTLKLHTIGYNLS